MSSIWGLFKKSNADAEVEEIGREAAEGVLKGASDAIEAHKGLIDVTDTLLNPEEIEDAADHASDIMEDIFFDQVGENVDTISGSLTDGAKVVDNLSDSMEGAAGKTSIFSRAIGKLKATWGNLAAKLGMEVATLNMWAIGIAAATAAIVAAVIAWDKFTTTVAEVDEEISKTTAKIETLKSKIKELEDIGYRTNEESQRLNALNKELELQEKLLEIEEKRRIKEVIGDKFSDQFDEENLLIGNKELDSWERLQSYRDLHGKYDKSWQLNRPGDEDTADYLFVKANEDLEKLRDIREDINKELSTYNSQDENDVEKLNKLYEKQDEKVSNVSDSISNLTEKNIELLDIISQLEEYQKRDDLSVKQQQQISYALENYRSMQTEIQSLIDNGLKEIGKYDYSSLFEGALRNVDGLKEELVDLAKQGKLDATNLASFLNGEILLALHNAGLEAADLYEYIMNIADPTKSWRDQTRMELYKDFRVTGYESYDKQASVNNILKEAGIDLENEDHLQAYLDVKAEFGDEAKYWTLDTWIKEIQKKLDKEEFEVTVETPSLKDIMARSTGKDEKGSEKTFGDDIDNYTSKINTLEEYLDKLNDGTYQETDLLALRKEFGLTGETVDQLKTEINELMQSELDTILETLDEIINDEEANGNSDTVKGLNQIRDSLIELVEVGTEADNALKQVRHANTDIWNSKTGMDKLSAIYKDIQDGAEFDWSSIVNNNEFREEFSRFGSEYQTFINGVFAHPKNIEANKKAFDDLADAYLKAEHVLDGLNDAEKEQAKRLLDSIGITNSAEMIQAEQTNKIIEQTVKQAQATQELAAKNANMISSTRDRKAAIEASYKIEQKEIASLFEVGGALENATQAQKAYYLEKLLSQMTDFTTNDIEQLNTIVQALGLGTDAWGAYYNARARLANVEAQFKAGKIDTTSYERMTAGITEELNRQIERYKTDISDAASSYLFGGDPANAGTEAADEYLNAFEKELGELQGLRDTGIIDEKDYLMRLQQLYVKYFANKKKYYEEFKKFEKEYLDGMRSLYESAISASITILNDQREEVEKAKEEATKILEEERDSLIDPINDRVKALEDERDAMQKANDQRERAINLQKAQYELERANSQRTRLIKIYVRGYSNIA